MKNNTSIKIDFAKQDKKVKVWVSPTDEAIEVIMSTDKKAVTVQYAEATEQDQRNTENTSEGRSSDSKKN